MAQGVANREARRRTVLRNWILERLSNLIWFLMLSALCMPLIVTLLLLTTLFVAKFCDIISGQNAGGAIAYFIFGHFDDACDQPLGTLAEIYWIVLAVKMTIIYIWSKAQEMDCDCNCLPRICNYLRSFLFGLVCLPAVAFELVWPILTFVYLCISSTRGPCSKELKQSCWILLAPYFLQIFGIFLSIIWPCLKPVLYRTGVIPDPGNRTREFQNVNFRPEDFVEDEGGYPASCSICLVDFSADDTDIVVTPCSGQKHVFHRACLANWFRVAQTCPLCRTALGDRVVQARQAPLTQSAREPAGNEAAQP